MTKKIFSLILALSVVLCTFAAISPVMAANNETYVSKWNGSLFFTDADGTTSTSWYESIKDDKVIKVYTANQLAHLAYRSKGNSYSGQTIKLMTDIDLEGHQWVPICDVPGGGFSGTFDGNGHTIKNLYGKNLVSPSDYKPERKTFGLIGVLNGTIKDLIIDGVVYDLDSACKDPIVGAICGTGGHWSGSDTATPKIQNCAVKNVTFNVTSSPTFSSSRLDGVAAVCGIVYRNTTITDTYAKNVRFNFASAVANFQHGGFANHLRSTAASFINCYLADAKESVENAEPTDLRFGYVQNSGKVSMNLCYTTSNTTESTNISTSATSAANNLRVNAALKDLNYGLVTTSNKTGSYIADTADKNGGFPLLAIEVPVRDLKITKDGDKFKASAEFTYPDREPKLFLAAYDKTTNMLVFAKAADENENTIISEEFLDYDAEKHIIKAFVWRLGDCTPFVESVTYTE